MCLGLLVMGAMSVAHAAPPANTQPAQGKDAEDLAKAWTDYLAGGLAGARKSSEKLVLSPNQSVSKEATYLLARCLWDAGSDESHALAKKTWDDLAKDEPATFIEQDWRTKGEWVGRYGTSMGICAAMAAPYDHVHGQRAPWFDYNVRIGKNCREGDSTRYWVQWLETKEPRSLVNLIGKGRRQSEWDDHGEDYPRGHDGPHLYVNLKTPPGTW